MAALVLFVMMVLGTTSANAGLLMSDFASPTDEPVSCSDEGIKFDMGIIVAGLTGIIVAGRDGIIVAGRDGIIVAGRNADCSSNDRTGILMSD